MKLTDSTVESRGATSSDTILAKRIERDFLEFLMFCKTSEVIAGEVDD